jgi:hypothetical protein
MEGNLRRHHPYNLGCIEDKGVINSKMVNIDDDLGRLLIRELKDYFNTQIIRENLTYYGPLSNDNPEI